MAAFLVLAALFCCCLVCAGFVAPLNDRVDSETEAWIEAKRTVKQDLVAPRTAKFPWGADRIVQQGGVWQVWGHVDSQNSFGAMIRSDWYCELRKTNGQWRCETLAIR